MIRDSDAETPSTICEVGVPVRPGSGRDSDLAAIDSAARAAEEPMLAQTGQLDLARRGIRKASVSEDLRAAAVEPVPRIALTQQETCASLGCSEEFFVEHVRPHLRVVRRGRKRLFPVAELRRAVDEMAEHVI